MKELEIVSCGAAYKHKKGFRFTQSTWQDCWLYTFFETDFISVTKNGMEKGRKYSYILHKPFSMVWHTNTADSVGGFTNDWMYFRGDFAENLIGRLHIPTNTIIQTRMGDSSSEIVRSIQREIAVDAPFREEKQKALFTLLFVGLSRAASENTNDAPEKKFSLYQVRDIMLNDFQHSWTIKELANLSGYSSSHFANLYKTSFGTSPLEELIAYRLAQARFMLESNSMSIGEIAKKCGFHSLYYFSRMYKQYNGISPMRYKQQFFKFGLKREEIL